MFNPWVRKIPWRREWLPTPVFLLGESHGQRSLVGYSLWGPKRFRQRLSGLVTNQHQTNPHSPLFQSQKGAAWNVGNDHMKTASVLTDNTVYCPRTERSLEKDTKHRRHALSACRLSTTLTCSQHRKVSRLHIPAKSHCPKIEKTNKRKKKSKQKQTRSTKL